MKKILSFLTAVAFLINGSVMAAWDGYIADKSRLDVIADMNNAGVIVEAGGTPSKTHVSTAAYSLRFYNHMENSEFLIRKVKRDWSEYEALQIDVYSEKATGGEIVMIAYSDYVPSDVFRTSYFSTRFTVDWVGWKTLTLKFSDFNNSNRASFSKMKSVGFCSNGWNAKPLPDTDLYFDTIYGVPKTEEAESGISKFTSSEIKKFYETAKGGIILMNQSRNVLCNETTTRLDAGNDRIKTTTKNGHIAVPLTFFGKYMGAELEETENAYTIKKEGFVAEIIKSDYSVKINGEIQNLSFVPYKDYGDYLYLPLHDIVNYLGMKAYDFNEFTYIGTEEQIEALKGDKRLRETGANELAGDLMDADSYTNADFAQARQNWKNYLVGDGSADLGNELVQKKLAIIDANCKSAWDMFNRSDDAAVLFGDTPVTATTQMTAQFDRLEMLANGYGTYGSIYYKNKQLKKDILHGLDWLYENLYGEDEINGVGWRSTELFDWYDWYVGSAMPLCNTLMIMNDDLYQEQVNKYLALHNHLRTRMRAGNTQEEAASRMYPLTASAILQNDKALFASNIADYKLTTSRLTERNGVREDYTYICHDLFPYTSLYGVAVQLRRYVPILTILNNTKMSIDNQFNYEPPKWIYYGYEPITWDGGLIKSFMGRNVLNEELLWGAFAIKSAVSLVGMYSEDDDIKLKTYVKRNINENSLKYILEWISIDDLEKLNDIINDDSIPSDQNIMSKVFYEGDRVNHFRKDYGISLAMSSSRIGNYESIDGVNKKGWYTGDGMIYTYMRNQPQQYGATFYNRANMYHMPGTTVDVQEREEKSILNAYTSNQDFVGGVSDGMYSAAAMCLESYHQEEKEDCEDSEYGGPKPIHHCSLTAKKSWFMFDDEVVALGADVNANDGYEVQTVYENRMLNKTAKLESAETSVENYKPVSVTATGDDGNIPSNVLDDDYTTRWSLAGTKDCFLTLELDDVHEIEWMGIAFYGTVIGNKSIFEIETSEDGVNYTVAYKGMSSGAIDRMEGFNLGGVKAKYIRYNGHGRTNSVWNSILEVKFYGKTIDGLFPADGKSGDTIYGAEDIIVDGNVLEKSAGYEKEFDTASYAHIEGLGGFYFPYKDNLHIAKRAGQPSFVEMWTSHGVSPQDKTYAYVMLPTKTAEYTKNYSDNPRIEIISNTSQLQAVRHKDLNITGMVFYSEGKCGAYEASEPMIVMVKENNGECVLSVSDPTKKLTSAELKVDPSYTYVSGDDEITFADGKITIDFENSRGKTYNVKFNSNK